MKLIITNIFLLFSIAIFAQNIDIKGHITNSKENPNYDEVFIYLINNEKVVLKSIADKNGDFELSNIPTGIYDLKISSFLLQDKIISNFSINSDTKNIEIEYPEPCKVSEKKCPYGDFNNIIPVVYGLPNNKLLKKAKKEKVKLGGCILTDCSPKWYCKTHKILF